MEPDNVPVCEEVQVASPAKVWEEIQAVCRNPVGVVILHTNWDIVIKTRCGKVVRFAKQHGNEFPSATIDGISHPSNLRKALNLVKPPTVRELIAKVRKRKVSINRPQAVSALDELILEMNYYGL